MTWKPQSQLKLSAGTFGETENCSEDSGFKFPGGEVLLCGVYLFSSSSSLPTTVQTYSFGLEVNLLIALSVHVRTNGCLFLYLALGWAGDLTTVYTSSGPKEAGTCSRVLCRVLKAAFLWSSSRVFQSFGAWIERLCSNKTLGTSVWHSQRTSDSSLKRSWIEEGVTTSKALKPRSKILKITY